jgi:voltage-gated potassium channel Kch
VQVLVFGLGRYGSRLLKQLRSAGVNALGVDFDPEAVRVLRRQGLPVRFGDGEDPEFVASLPLAEARWVISTVPAWPANRALLHALEAAPYRGAVLAVARDAEQARALAKAGVRRIASPFDDAADHAAAELAAEILSTEDVRLHRASQPGAG